MAKGFNIRVNVNGVNKYIINEEFIDSVSYLTETSSNASDIYYGINEDTGDISVYDFDETFRKILSDSIENNEEVGVDLYLGDNKIGSGITESAELVEDNKIDFHLSSILSGLQQVNFSKRFDNYTFFDLYIEALSGLGFVYEDESNNDLSPLQEAAIILKLQSTSDKVYFDNDNSYNIIEYICQAFQLAFILDNNGKPLLVDANPICEKADVANAINLSDNYIIGDIEKDAFVTNKTEAVGIKYFTTHEDVEKNTVVYNSSVDLFSVDTYFRLRKQFDSGINSTNHNIFEDVIDDYYNDIPYNGGTTNVNSGATKKADAAYVEIVKGDDGNIHFAEKRKESNNTTKLISDSGDTLSTLKSYQYIRKLYINGYDTFDDTSNNGLVKISNVEKYKKAEAKVRCLTEYSNLYIGNISQTKKYSNFVVDSDRTYPEISSTDYEIEKFIEENSNLDINSITTQFYLGENTKSERIYSRKDLTITNDGIPEDEVSFESGKYTVSFFVPIGLELLCAQDDSAQDYPLGAPYNPCGFLIYEHPELYEAIDYSTYEKTYNDAGVSFKEGLSFGRKRLIPLSYDISIYGDKTTTSFDEVDNSTDNIKTSKNSYEASSNILVDKDRSNTIKSNILDYYKKGVRTAKCTIFAKDFYNVSGVKVVDSKKGQIVDINDIVCFNNDDDELWRVVGREINVSDDIYETLTLREIVKTI